MRSFRRLSIAAAGLALLLQADLGPWIQHIPGTSTLRAIFFRDVQLPAGIVPSRRPPQETIPALTKTITTAPKRADLYYLRAREAELNLDFELAESSWKSYAELSSDKVALADYYHRRLQVREELDALLAAARSSDGDELYSRALDLANNQALGPAEFSSIYRAWIERFPEKATIYEAYANYLIEAGEHAQAQALAAEYAKRFPNDDLFPTRIRAEISGANALQIYDAGLRPLSSPAYVARYFQLLERSRALRAFVGRARESVAREPLSIEPATRLFYYYQQSGRLADAHRALLELAARKNAAGSQWSAQEQITLAKLFEATQNYPEAARYYNNAWRQHSSEDGLTGLIGLLFTAPEQELGIGQGDLTFYSDIATIDRYPGTLNGILSLLFNTTYPRSEFAEQERAAVPYFHRAKASELIAELDRRFPNSSHRPVLRSRLIQSYATYGANDAVVKLGREYLLAFPQSTERTEVALAMADAYARLRQPDDEFRIYDELLKELAAAADGRPLGSATDAIPEPAPEDGSVNVRPYGEPRPSTVRSPMYAQVLDRYVSRLVAVNRTKEALALYRSEIDRNPNDPGLYERLAAFMAQHRMATDIADVYTRAMRRFQDRSWHHKLARWYLRRQQTAAFNKVSRDFISVFSGSELEEYFNKVVATANLDAVLYRELNRYAHQRFPNDLVFVRNLLTAYERRGTADPAAYETLLRRFWYYDDDLRSRFFQLLSRSGRLEAELNALEAGSATSRASLQFVAEGRAWQSHFEQAVKPADALATLFPGDADLNNRSASLLRSFGRTDEAVRTVERMSRAAPRDRDILARLGDILAERDRISDAKRYWSRMPSVAPGNLEGWLETATVYWDWFQYDDALRVINEARVTLRKPTAFAYEAGAIHESKREYRAAVDEYIKAADEGRSLRRLLRLAERRDTRDLVETATRGNFELRVALLEDQNRRDDLRNLLQERVRSADSMDALQRVESIAQKNDFAEMRDAALQRQIAVSPDPVERLRLQIALARILEDRGDKAAAEKVLAAAYKSHPETLGVIRAAVDFYWRTGQRDQAIETLANAASRANSTYRRGFLLEAARKATDAQQYARARQLLDPLLTGEPAAPDLIAAVADTWARAGEDRQLREFYAKKLADARSVEQQTALRRSLIPVLIRMNDHSGALEQYIEIARRYPEDVALIQEASTFARRNNLHDQLVGWFAKAERESPKDARWPMLLARVLTNLEQPEAAIAAYTRASTLRPDRPDLHSARADLEERLFRFEQAAASYARLYELTYRNPSWMVKSAEANARLGRRDAAVAALRKAFIEDRPPQPRDYIEAARRLASWNLVREAKEFADKAPVTEDPGFQQWLNARLRQAPRPLAIEAATVVDLYYTPEEKLAIAATVSRADVGRAAGLMDVAARAMRSSLRQSPAQAVDGAYSLIQLQQQRAQYRELAQELEALWKLAPPPTPNRDSLLVRAADNWRYAGAVDQELRVLGTLIQMNSSGNWLPRYLHLLARTAPDQLVARAQAGPKGVRTAAAAAAVAEGGPELALRAIQARGTGLPPVWTSAYTALTGFYFDTRTPEVLGAFDATLGPRTVAAQLATKFDRNVQIAGDVWFYYAARYGELLDSPEYLPATVESRPASAQAYLDTADWLRENGKPAQALDEYGRALQIDDKLAVAHARMAEILAGTGRGAEAVAHWRQAFQLWSAMQSGRLPASFWTDVQQAITHAGRAKALTQLRADIDGLLRTYLRRSGTYRVRDLFATLFAASAGGSDSLRWILDLSSAAPVRSELLLAIVREPWIPASQRESLYREILSIAEAELATRTGESRADAEWRLRNARLQWIESLIDSGDLARASAALPTPDADTRVAILRLKIAALRGELQSEWQRYRERPQEQPSSDAIQQLAAGLRERGAAAPARQLLEGLYRLRLEQGSYDASTFLGLAEVLLESGQSATPLLQRMVLLVPEPFETLRPAAQLLQRFNQSAESREFLRKRVQAVPWDASARTELAALEGDSAQLRAIASDPQVAYADRAEAASKLKGVSGLGSAELDLLASGNPISPVQAERPYFFRARVSAAQSSSNNAVRARLLRSAVGIAPDDRSVRVALFRTLLEAKSYAAAAGLWEPELHWVQSDDMEEHAERWLAQGFLREYPDRARIATELSRAYLQMDRPGPARTLLAIAREIDPSSVTVAQVAALEKEVERRAANRARMPVITEGVEQPGRVRPRLTAQAGGAR